MRRSTLPLLGLLPLLAGCYTMGTYDSARMLRPGEAELTPFYSQSRLTWKELWRGPSGTGYAFVDADNEKVGDHLGLQVLLPLTSRLNLRLRAERIDMEGSHWNAARLGPKFGLVPDRLALDLPVGLYFGEDVDEGQTVHVLPGLIGTLPLGARHSLSGIARYHHYFDGDDFVELALGAEWAAAEALRFRPEIGWLLQEGTDARYFHAGVGLSLRLGSAR